MSEPYAIVDSHCHLDAEPFDADRAEVLARARAAGVTVVVVPGTDLASSRKAVDLVRAASGEPRLFAAVGIHPHSASECLTPAEGTADDVLEALRGLALEPGVVAIGETGLDYHYNFSPPDVQRASLRRQVRLARALDRPLILHCRDAEADILRIIAEEGASGGVVHCYTGGLETAQALLAAGFYLGFTGIVTFKNSQALRDVAAAVPLDRILLETDSPYLAPIPHRGRRNEPAFLPGVAAVIAGLHGLSAAALAQRAAENTARCFRLPGA